MKDFSKLLKLWIEAEEGEMPQAAPQAQPNTGNFNTAADITDEMDPSKTIATYLQQQEATADTLYQAVDAAITKAMTEITQVQKWTPQGGGDSLGNLSSKLKRGPVAGQFPLPKRPTLQSGQDLHGTMGGGQQS